MAYTPGCNDQHEVHVRSELAVDAPHIRHVNTEAFGGPAEAKLVEALRQAGQIAISLVAEVKNEVVGHVLLSPVTLMPSVPGLRMLGFGPVAVLPKHQRRGIGSMLMNQAIDQARSERWHAAVVLGHPEYYTRFGFVPAKRFGLGCEFPVPDEAFMALELEPDGLKGLRGVVRYQPEFSMV